MARLEAADGMRTNLTVRNVVDRPPRETREQWIARKANELGVTPTSLGGAGELVLAPNTNVRGESFSQWVARRQAELGFADRQEHRL